jgi:hypothetical protein
VALSTGLTDFGGSSTVLTGAVWSCSVGKLAGGLVDRTSAATDDVIDEVRTPDEARGVGCAGTVMLGAGIGSSGMVSVDDDAAALACTVGFKGALMRFLCSRSVLAGEGFAGKVLRKVNRYDLPADDLTGVPLAALPVPGCGGFSTLWTAIAAADIRVAGPFLFFFSFLFFSFLFFWDKEILRQYPPETHTPRAEAPRRATQRERL